MTDEQSTSQASTILLLRDQIVSMVTCSVCGEVDELNGTTVDGKFYCRNCGLMCETCYWFAHWGGDAGECRRNPPRAGKFERILKTEWCGEHRWKHREPPQGAMKG